MLPNASARHSSVMWSSLFRRHCGLMDEMLIRLSCDQRSNACNTSFSASAVSSESVLLVIPSQRARMVCSRSKRKLPWLTDFFSSAMRVDRSFQLVVSGEIISLSDASNAMPPIARMARRRWRFSIFTSPSFAPLKVERELQRMLAANLIDLEIADLLGGTHVIKHLQEGLVVTRDAGAGHRGWLADFKGAGRNDTVLGKRLGKLSQDGQAPEGVIEPGAESFDLLLHIFQFLHLRFHRRPLGLIPGQLPLLD